MNSHHGSCRTFKIVLEYDGSEFNGWQIQPNKRTVQDEVEKAIFTITGEKIRVTGAGRTDAGVHALGQVASFNIRNSSEENRLIKALNAVLPSDIQIIELQQKENQFNARRDAICRTYRYVIAKHPKAIGRQYAWYPRLRYDLDLMISVSEFLKGEHCWKAFCKTEEHEKKYQSTVQDVFWQINQHDVQFYITAERFFHNMVRIILGTLFDVGRGKMSVEQMCSLFKSNDRKKAGITLPPHGLTLMRVDY